MYILKLIIITFLITIFADNKASFSNIQNNNTQTKIKSQFIHIKRKSNKIEFSKNAIIENGDTSILSDKVIVFYEDEDSNKSNLIKEAHAIGNVKIFNQEFVATGESGVYDPNEESFTIKDNVIFNNGTSIAKGEKFIYNIKAQKGWLVGDKENAKKLKNDDRVIVIINEENE
jgi:lipopolysaccharide transport protein LptA